LFDVYPDQIFIDPRNALSTVYNNPVATTNKAVGGYNSGRDQSNRGRFLYPANQFGYNGRYVFGRVAIDLEPFLKHFKK